MNLKAAYLGIWCGVLGFVFLIVGQVILLGYLPPIDPSLSPAEVGAYFRDNQTAMLTGSMCLQYGATFLIPFYVAIAQLIMRIEAPSRFFTHIFLVGIVLGFFGLYVNYGLWSAAAYRPERPDDLILLLNDASTFLFIGNASQALVLFGSAGFAILGDRSPSPLLPRWIGYLSIWTALLSLPNTFVGLFKSGPFAWNGLIDFWIPAVVFGNWTVILLWYGGKAYARLIREEQSS